MSGTKIARRYSGSVDPMMFTTHSNQNIVQNEIACVRVCGKAATTDY